MLHCSTCAAGIFTERYHSGESRSVTITNEHARLTQEELDRMILEAEEFAAADKAHRLRIEALGSLKNYVGGYLAVYRFCSERLTDGSLTAIRCGTSDLSYLKTTSRDKRSPLETNEYSLTL